MKHLLTAVATMVLSSSALAHDIGASVQNQQCRNGEWTYLYSQHHAHLYNNTDQYQNYLVYFQIWTKPEADARGRGRDGTSWQQSVSLAPHTERNFSIPLEMQIICGTPGIHPITGFSLVQGDGGEKHETIGWLQIGR